MNGVVVSVFIVQAALMLVDEFLFHRVRGLPRWERIGHPIDTLSVLACLALTLLQPFGPSSLAVYAGLALLSCVLVTKDELVHARECQPIEQWLHALLFVLHPLVLGAAAFAWWRGERTLLWVQSGLTLAFMLYQIGYWNFYRDTHDSNRQRLLR